MSSGRRESSFLSVKNTAQTDFYETHSPGVGNEFDTSHNVCILLHTWQIILYL